MRHPCHPWGIGDGVCEGAGGEGGKSLSHHIRNGRSILTYISVSGARAQDFLERRVPMSLNGGGRSTGLTECMLLFCSGRSNDGGMHIQGQVAVPPRPRLPS